tara:strand:+ start:3877 stop:4203 length:327 start_codon:yes stop_codon:yes gene_type:complete
MYIKQVIVALMISNLAFVPPILAVPDIGTKVLILQDIAGKVAKRGEVHYVTAWGVNDNFRIGTGDFYSDGSQGYMSIADERTFLAMGFGVMLVIAFALGWNSRTPSSL